MSNGPASPPASSTASTEPTCTSSSTPRATSAAAGTISIPLTHVAPAARSERPDAALAAADVERAADRLRQLGDDIGPLEAVVARRLGS